MPDVSLNPSITPSFTTTPVQGAEAPAPQETGQSYTPLWMVNDSVGGNAFEMLGMRLPKASGDVAALLAEISLTLELSIDEAEKNKALSGLARFAAALGGYGVKALREMVIRTEGAVEGAATRRAEYDEASADLVSQRDALNTRIGNYNAQISSLEGQLSALETQLSKAKDADKPAIQAQINAVNATLSGVRAARNEALAERKAVEIALAELKIATLEAQVADLEAQLAQAPEDTEEAAELGNLIDDVNSKLGAMRGRLDDLRSEPYTESSGNSRHNAIETNFNAGFNRVQATLGEMLKAGYVALEELGALALAVAAQTAASLNAEKSAGSEAHRELGVERSFEEIADELQAASQRLTKALINADKRDDAKLDRIEEIARGLLAAISDIVQALEGLGDTLPSAPPAGRSVGNRLRLEV